MSSQSGKMSAHKHGTSKGVDLYDEAGVLAGNKVAERFRRWGIVPFPEVELSDAVRITGIPRSIILKALRTRKLCGRRVYEAHMIRIVDLWHFAVSLESEKILKKNRR